MIYGSWVWGLGLRETTSLVFRASGLRIRVLEFGVLLFMSVEIRIKRLCRVWKAVDDTSGCFGTQKLGTQGPSNPEPRLLHG